ncbi:hypothetical protein V2G26_005380 [Clonostachys chloroleuca]
MVHPASFRTLAGGGARVALLSWTDTASFQLLRGLAPASQSTQRWAAPGETGDRSRAGILNLEHGDKTGERPPIDILKRSD